MALADSSVVHSRECVLTPPQLFQPEVSFKFGNLTLLGGELGDLWAGIRKTGNDDHANPAQQQTPRPPCTMLWCPNYLADHDCDKPKNKENACHVDTPPETMIGSMRPDPVTHKLEISQGGPPMPAIDHQRRGFRKESELWEGLTQHWQATVTRGPDGLP